MCLPHVVRHTGGAQARPRPAPVDRLRGADGVHSPRAVDEDPVVGDQPVDVVDVLRERRQQRPGLLLEPLVDVPHEAPDPPVGDHHAGAGYVLHERVDLLAAAEQVPEVRQGAEVDEVRPHADEVVHDARQLAEDHADPLRARRDLDAQELLDRHRVSHVVQERAHVVEPVRVGEDLLPRMELGHLLEAAMEIADLGDRFDDRLAVEPALEPEGPVHGGMAGPDVDHHQVLGQRIDREALVLNDVPLDLEPRPARRARHLAGDAERLQRDAGRQPAVRIRHGGGPRHLLRGEGGVLEDHPGYSEMGWLTRARTRSISSGEISSRRSSGRSSFQRRSAG